MCQLDSHQPPRFSLFGSASFRPRRKYVGRRCQKPVLRRCLQAAVSAAPWKKTCGMLPHTNCRSYKTLKINGWNIIPWRWMEDHFPFFSWVICRFHVVNLPGCKFNAWNVEVSFVATFEPWPHTNLQADKQFASISL